jgi:hypothetical protein
MFLQNITPFYVIIIVIFSGDLSKAIRSDNGPHAAKAIGNYWKQQRF